MDMTNKHIGNLLARMSDAELHEVLEQYAAKKERSQEELLSHFGRVIKCEQFDYMGNIVEQEDFTKQARFSDKFAQLCKYRIASILSDSSEPVNVGLIQKELASRYDIQIRKQVLYDMLIDMVLADGTVQATGMDGEAHFYEKKRDYTKEQEDAGHDEVER